MDSRALRRNFVAGLFKGLRVVWPILSGLLLLIVGFGVVVGLIEGWSLQESVYFSFVSGLTIGYGDFAPKTLLGRGLAIAIGVCGILVTALVAAVAVKGPVGWVEAHRAETHHFLHHTRNDGFRCALPILRDSF